jgi:3-dehydroquinate dehydratase-2
MHNRLAYCMKLMILNGPNLNLLGTREPEIYGSQTFENFYHALIEKYKEVEFTYFQSNVEGELINAIQGANGYSGIILNAGGYTHTSVAIADCIAAVTVPVIEVHISNPSARETFRHTSLLAGKCLGSISGFGLYSYELAVQAFIERVLPRK